MPQTLIFRASRPTFMVLVGLVSLPAVVFACNVFAGHRGDLITWLAVAIPPALMALWLSRFRLRFDATGFTHSSLFGGSRTFAYDEILSLQVQRLPIRGQPLKVTLRCRDGRESSLNMNPFERGALATLRVRVR